MRDRLIELLQEFTDNNNGGGSNHGRADYLLANGVIVPPCRVGDTVYVIIDMDNPARRMLECKVISISMEETGMHFKFQTVKKYLYRYGNFDIDDIGKTVFLTYEQAEKALAEVANGK